ncbi:MAG: hypothetical protein ABS46_16520 [Cytophagaceae bacterium SCN 52-12]|nr:MAG: hypothetical protein ABS46_16520 [Cytophagaceae bacterium SCN 52-12]
MSVPFIPSDLLEKYLNGTATPAEREVVEAWYASLRHNPDYLGSLPEAGQKAVREETFHHILRHLASGDPDNVHALPVTRTRVSRLWIGAGAAVAMIITAVSIGLWLSNSSLPAPHQPAASGKMLSFVRFINHEARIVRKQLPDGTVVRLHPQAELRYPAAFAPDRREVEFAGEAFFDVAKDTSRPFSITSGKMKIQVVGTSFNVRATPGQALFEVAVLTGRVIVGSVEENGKQSGETVTLLPRQEVLYNVETSRLTLHEQSAQSRQELYQPVSIAFSDTPINSVLEQLEARFQVNFRLANPALNRCRLTADFTDQSLPDILELLCTALDATYTMAGDTIMLNGEGCP